jgi:hypothetical protein
LSAFTLVEGDVTLRSGGIETAASDGIPLLIGTRGYIGVGFDGTNTRFIRVDTLGRTIIVGPDAPGASATGNPIVGAGVDIGGFVRQIFTDTSGRQRIVGAADNATPVTGSPVLVGGSDGTNVYRLLTDTAGRLQVVATGSSGGTSSTYGAVFPATGTASGFFDGTNMQGARVFDLDTGAGTEWDLGVSIRLPGAGGSVVGGTLSDPIRTDPTGTTAQPVTDNGASLTVDTPQLPAALVGGRLDSNVGAWLGSTAPTVGQKTMANSVPVVFPSDQSLTTSLTDAAGNPVSTSPATLLPAQIHRVQVQNAGSPNLRVDGSGTPVNFDVPADGTDDIWVDEIRITMTANPVDTDGAHFGPVTTLTNGLRIQVRSNGVTTDLVNMKLTEDFLAYSSREASRIDRSGSKDTLVAGWCLGGIVKLLNGSGDFVRVTVRDNLTSVKFLYLTCTVHGIKKAP